MPKTILVVDDDPVGTTLMQNRLTKAGYVAVCANNGQKGLAALAANNPAMVILDVEMPEMNGYSFLVEMRKMDAHKDKPVVVLTSHQENKPIFFRRGISHYLIKPVNFDELFQKINALIGQP